MNDVLKTRGIHSGCVVEPHPDRGVGSVAAIAMFCNFLIGYGAHRRGIILFLVLPLVPGVATGCVYLVLCPRGGVIRVRPHNLESLAQLLNGQSL
jgi:hypothetical protein